MAHYRAVMGTTLDCEGCKFDGDECSSEEGCIAFANVPRSKDKVSLPVKEGLEDFLRQHEPWMFEWKD